MGCDIHMFCEIRFHKEGKWQEVGKIFKNKYHKPGKENVVDEDGYEWNPEFVRTPYDIRNYDLFAILADVRNGRGFASIKTGEGFVPICEPKGLPKDVSEFIREQSDRWDGDGHSHSFLTVQELKDYDWDQTTVLRGSIPFEDWKKLHVAKKCPEAYCGAISGPGIVTIDETTASLILDGKIPKDLEGKRIYVDYYWSETYRSCCDFFVEETIPELEKLGDPKDVRIVFWFDN